MFDWVALCKNMTDEQLQYELLKLTNDSILLTDAEKKQVQFNERHFAIWSEIEFRRNSADTTGGDVVIAPRDTK